MNNVPIMGSFERNMILKFVGMAVLISISVFFADFGSLDFFPGRPLIINIVFSVIVLIICIAILYTKIIKPRLKNREAVLSGKFDQLFKMGFQVDDDLTLRGIYENYSIFVKPHFDLSNNTSGKISFIDMDSFYELENIDDSQKFEEKISKECGLEELMFADNNADLFIEESRFIDFESKVKLLVDNMKKFELEPMNEKEAAEAWNEMWKIKR
jgi:hypothetical protein